MTIMQFAQMYPQEVLASINIFEFIKTLDDVKSTDAPFIATRRQFENAMASVQAQRDIQTGMQAAQVYSQIEERQNGRA